MKILIIEDEIPAAQQLSDVVSAIDPEIQILNILDSNSAVLSWFKSADQQPDLIFSDIELLDGNVFNSLFQLDLRIPIIFTTAYHQFTMKAFETSGIAYLLKPIDSTAVRKAIIKYQDLTNNSDSVDLKLLLDKLKMTVQDHYKQRFSVKVGQGIYLLKSEDITCLIMKNGVLHAYKENGKSFILSTNMQDVVQQLDPSMFHQLNRSNVVNINFLNKVENYFNDRLAVFIQGQDKPLITSASRTSGFRKWMDDA